MEFKIDDDDGVMHTIRVPNSVHIPDLPIFLVFPQHWAQQTTDDTKSRSGDKHTNLTFCGYKKTIPYSTHSNVPSFRSTQGCCDTRLLQPASKQPRTPRPKRSLAPSTLSMTMKITCQSKNQRRREAMMTTRISPWQIERERKQIYNQVMVRTSGMASA